MRWTRIIPYLALAATLASCDGAPVDPQPDEVLNSSFKVTHTDWVQHASLDGVQDYIECANNGAGEVVVYFGSYDTDYSSTSNPSGNETVHWKIDYSTATLGFTGMDSGDRWEIDRGEDTGSSVSKASGVEYVYHWQLNEWYVNQDDEVLHLRAKYRIMIDADGSVKSERFDGWCPGKP